MRSEKEIQERIEHIKTLSNGYGVNDKRIKELEWVLNLKNKKNKSYKTADGLENK